MCLMCGALNSGLVIETDFFIQREQAGLEYKLIFLFFDEREGIECWK